MRAITLTAIATALLAVAASVATANYCGFTPYSTTASSNTWDQVVQWNNQGTTFAPTCWQASIAGLASGTGSVNNKVLPTAITCTTGSWGGNTTVLYWIDGMSSPSIDIAALTCPYTGYFSVTAFLESGKTLYYEGAASVSTTAGALAAIPTAKSSREQRSVVNHAHLLSAATTDVKDAGYCGYSPIAITVDSSYGGMAPQVWWSTAGTSFTLSCMRATTTGVWPVEIWVGCTSDLYYNTASNVTIISRLPGNYLPNGTTVDYKCPFTGYFALFVQSQPVFDSSFSVTVEIDGAASVGGSSTVEAGFPAPRH
eukprot:CAMPEP_0174846070 /NCGR_PEP_ID=MMETSP1114-20130205/12102_1 /TAXON_ID=312471 /ORGANISM="Neobodo designis, Strain CCAP 1951/1" /LENGTH=311 /DNA_ID=CAMNT_0016080329 /DNA_START=76 /DNA_END=1011 /DNA_ORIENTATION=+